MTLSELLDENSRTSAEEQLFIEHTRSLWAKRFARIVKESRGRKI